MFYIHPLNVKYSDGTTRFDYFTDFADIGGKLLPSNQYHSDVSIFKLIPSMVRTGLYRFWNRWRLAIDKILQLSSFLLTTPLEKKYEAPLQPFRIPTYGVGVKLMELEWEQIFGL